MLAVKPDYRNHDLGYKLKLAQREAVLAQALNKSPGLLIRCKVLTHILISPSLGVVADAYRIQLLR